MREITMRRNAFNEEKKYLMMNIAKHEELVQEAETISERMQELLKDNVECERKKGINFLDCMAKYLRQGRVKYKGVDDSDQFVEFDCSESGIEMTFSVPEKPNKRFMIAIGFIGTNSSFPLHSKIKDHPKFFEPFKRDAKNEIVRETKILIKWSAVFARTVSTLYSNHYNASKSEMRHFVANQLENRK